MLKIEYKFHYNRINESVRMQNEYEYFEYEINAEFRCTILMALRILRICWNIFDVQYTRREMKELVLRMNRQLLNHRMSRLFSYSFLSRQNLRRGNYSCYIKGSSLYVWQMRNRGADAVVAEHLPARWPLLIVASWLWAIMRASPRLNQARWNGSSAVS